MYRKVCVVAALAIFAAFALARSDNAQKLDEVRFGRVSVEKEERVTEGKPGMLSVPWRINYQGYLTDDAGNPVNDTLRLDFKIFDRETMGTQLWWGIESKLAVENGLFNIVLGEVSIIPPSVFEGGESRWLQLEVEMQVLSPRTEIASVGYAYRAYKSGTAEEAYNSDSLDGFNASATPGMDDLFPLSFGDVNFVNEGQTDAVTSNMIVNGTLLRDDVSSTFKAPYADTSDFAFAASVGHVDSARISGNSWRLEDHAILDLDSIWVNEGQADAVTSSMVFDGTLARVDVADTFKAPYSDTADYAFNAVTDSDWVITGSVIYPSGDFGLAMSGASVLYGESTYTHVNLGVACTTGTAGESYRYSTVGGGWRNAAGGVFATVGGGHINCAVGHRSAIGGGEGNTASDWYATVGGGELNSAFASHSTVSGGYMNAGVGLRSTIGGGYADTAVAEYGTVAGGYLNRAGGAYAAVGGGSGSMAGGAYSAVGGGSADTASADYATVAGGLRNKAGGAASVVSGGSTNSATADAAVVSGGYQNVASNLYSTVSGGWSNVAGGAQAGVGGGRDNSAGGDYSFVGGGLNNSATGARANVGGGSENEATGPYAAVSGGSENSAAGQAATVAGGWADSVAGDYSFVAGRQVVVDSAADYTLAFGRGFTTSTPNAVIFHNSSSPIRVGIGNTAPTHLLDVGASGAYCDGGNWVDGSSREYKGGISELSLEDAVEAVGGLTPVTYHYNVNPGEMCVGFIAEDVPDLVATKDRKGLSPMDIVAVLTRVVQNQQQEIELLKKEIEALKAD